jgi:hypothetical protein
MAGERDKADKELLDFIDNASLKHTRPEERLLANFLLSKLPEQQFLEFKKTGDDQPSFSSSSIKAVRQFYAGMMRLLEDDHLGAAELLRLVVAHPFGDFPPFEFHWAQQELSRLDKAHAPGK